MATTLSTYWTSSGRRQRLGAHRGDCDHSGFRDRPSSTRQRQKGLVLFLEMPGVIGGVLGAYSLSLIPRMSAGAWKASLVADAPQVLRF